MSKQLLNILLKWVKVSGYTADETKVETLFFSHPDMGDIVSITDTLNDLGIENTVAEIPKESIAQLKDPFIASVKSNNQNGFVLAHLKSNEEITVDTGNNKSITVSLKEFTDRWNGVIIVIDKIKAKYLKVAITKLIPFTLFIICFGFFIFLNIGSLDVFNCSHFFLSIIGTAISSFIIIQELGFKSSFVNKVCNLNATTSCSIVFASKPGKINQNLGLSDLCVAYFFSQILYWLILGSIRSNNHNLLFLISLFSLPITFYSIYAQKFIIKKWCPLCLGIVTVLWLQAFIAGIFFIKNTPPFNINLPQLFGYFFTVLLAICIWFLAKPILINAAKFKASNIDALSFRRNYHLFIPFYANQKVHDMEISGLKDFSVGNSNATIKIVVVLSPDCPICSYTNEVLNRLVDKYPSDICINYRLLANPYQSENIKTKSTVYLLTQFLLHNQPVDTLTKWYSKTVEEQLPNNFTISEKHNTELSILRVYEQWCKHNNILYTPAIFINGKLFPNYYDNADIKYFIDEIINYELGCINHDAQAASSTTVLVDNT
jgi:uncharacterized membrane protein